MIIDLPFKATSLLFKRRGVESALRYISTKRSFKLSNLSVHAYLTKRVASALLKDLMLTEHIVKSGAEYKNTENIRGNSIVINVRDVRCDVLFKRKGTRTVLLQLCKGFDMLSELSLSCGLAYRTLQRIISDLRRAGLMRGLSLNEEVLVTPRSVLEYIPRKEHRLVLQNLLSILESQNLPDYSLIAYGDASHGQLSHTLELLLLIKGALKPEDQGRLMEALVLATKNIVSAFGVMIDLTFALEEVFIAQKVGIAVKPNDILTRAFEGICLRGHIPNRDDYFELHQFASPTPPYRIDEMTRKGYIQKVGGRLVYTDKAIKKFKAEAPTNIIEASVPVLNREVRFITVGEPKK